MQFHIEAPSSLEAQGVKVDSEQNQLVIEPAIIKNQHILRAGYITAVGAGGAENKAVILFNGNTGSFSIQEVGEKVTLAFDKPKEEFEKRRESSRATWRKKREKERERERERARASQTTPVHTQKAE